MTSGNGDKESRRGFGGLEDLLSDDTSETRQSQPEAGPSASQHAAGASDGSPGDTVSSAGATSPSSGRREGNSSLEPVADPAASTGGTGWGWLLAGLAFVAISIAILDNKASSDRSGAVNSYSTTAPGENSYATTPQQEAWTETPPPTGQGRVLTRDELRYCRSELVRLEAMEAEVDEANSAHIDVFNIYVDDYNGRCGNFQYYEDMLSEVQRQVDAAHSRLAIEGAARIASEPSLATSPAPKSSELQPNITPDSAFADTDEQRATDGIDTVPELAMSQGGIKWTDLTAEERQSLNDVCEAAARAYRADPFDTCFNKQLAALAGADAATSQRGIQWTDLTAEQRQSLNGVCEAEARTYREDAFDICFNQQLAALAGAVRNHDMQGLSDDAIDSIRTGCFTVRDRDGPAAYHGCIEERIGVVRASIRAQTSN